MANFKIIRPIEPKNPNAINVEGAYFPLPLKMVGPTTYGEVISADYGVSPINGEKLTNATFAHNAELAGFALREHQIHKKDGKLDSNLKKVIDSINGSGKVLTGNTMMIVGPKWTYFVNYPSKELVTQFGRNEQNTLDRLTQEFNKELRGEKEQEGIYSLNNIRKVLTANIFQGDQSRNLREDNYLGKNKGLIALTSQRIANSLANGSKAYSSNPYFGLNAEANKLVTRVPVLDAFGFGYALYVGGYWNAGNDARCSFGEVVSDEATRAKK